LSVGHLETPIDFDWTVYDLGDEGNVTLSMPMFFPLTKVDTIILLYTTLNWINNYWHLSGCSIIDKLIKLLK